MRSGFLVVLRARRGVFLVMLVSVVVAATVASLVMPKSYRATVSLLVDSQDQQLLGDALQPLALPQEHLSYIQTQVDILTSPKVARDVIQDLGLANDADALAVLDVPVRSDGRTVERLVDVLTRQLKVDTSQSSVIQASFVCSDPQLAARIANGFAKAYLDTSLQLRTAPAREAAAWFKDQLNGLRANVRAAQAKVAARPERLPQVQNDAVIQQLRAELLRGEANLESLATQYGVNHPVYRQQLIENQALRAQLQAELKRVESVSVPRVDSGTEGGVSEQSGSGATEPVLAGNVESAERTYDAAVQRYVESQVNSRANQTNVTVLNPAVAPLLPYRPKPLLNLVLALLSGCMLGGAVVALLEMQDPRVHSPIDLVGLAEIPLLGVLGERSSALLSAPPARSLPALPHPG